MAEFLPLIIIGALMYGVLILPQQRRSREHKATLASLEEGDEVVTSSGIYGFIAALEPDVIWLEVAEGTELKVSRSSVASKIVVPDVEEDSESDTDPDSADKDS